MSLRLAVPGLVEPGQDHGWWRRATAGALVLAGLVSAAILGTIGPAAASPQSAEAAIRIVVEKARHRMTLYRDGEPFRTFKIALGRGGLAAKRREGDYLTPEGSYRIVGRNPNSPYHLSLRVSYPEPRDIEAAKARGLPPGGDIMIHGIGKAVSWRQLKDWTFGCIAVTDAEMEEIWKAVPDGTPIEIKA